MSYFGSITLLQARRWRPVAVLGTVIAAIVFTVLASAYTAWREAVAVLEGLS